MENNDLEKVTRPRREIEVLYVPDEVIEIIIPNENIKNDGRRRRTIGTPSKEFVELGFPNSGRRLTRSGRQITSRLQQLSLNESSVDRPQIRDNGDHEVEEWNDCDVEKPSDKLFDEEDIDGGTIFSFRTPKRQNGMVNRASDSVTKILKRPIETEREKPLEKEHRKKVVQETEDLEPAPPKTPYGLRNKLKERIAIEVEKQELDRLLEDSGSEYNPSFSESDSDTSDSEPEVLSPEQEFSPPAHKARSMNHTPAKKTRQQMKDYVFSSEEYFDRRYSKIMTSNNTLRKLKRPKLAPSQLASLLKSLPKTHAESYENLQCIIESSFKRWLFALSEGYNIILFGVGSKREILANFHDKYLRNSFTIDIHGYFPDNMIKDVLTSIATSCLKLNNVPNQPHEIIEVIKEKMKSKTANRVFILISNLDGKFLQNDKTQTLISQLVSIPKIHMLATIDHINSALLWDQRKLSAFNFIWEDATTFLPYTEETSYEGSLMVNWSGGIAMSSLKNVFTSLTSNSRKVFKILLKHHLEHHGPKYSGMHFSDLYRECRAGFVVSSDLALRTLLTEFMDHELVKWKKETDHLIITVDIAVLKQFQAEMDYLT